MEVIKLFRKGDKVILKTDLVLKEYYGGGYYYDDLQFWQGKEMTIQKKYTKNGDTYYLVNENNYTWAEGLLDMKK